MDTGSSRRRARVRFVQATATLVAALTLVAIAQGVDDVQKLAEGARRNGQTSRTYEVVGGSRAAFDFSGTLENGAVYLVTATGRRVAINLGSTIITWHWLRVDDTLVRKAHNPERCFDELPNAPAVGVDEIGVVTPGGTTSVDGVEVTIVDKSWPQWLPKSGERFLLLARFCAPRQVILTYGTNSVVPVSADGTLMLTAEQARVMGGVNTVADVRQRLVTK